ncbi:hypothetical protein ACFL1H_04100 [Nanoarchaeota archaeon]
MDIEIRRQILSYVNENSCTLDEYIDNYDFKDMHPVDVYRKKIKIRKEIYQLYNTGRLYYSNKIFSITENGERILEYLNKKNNELIDLTTFLSEAAKLLIHPPKLQLISSLEGSEYTCDDFELKIVKDFHEKEVYHEFPFRTVKFILNGYEELGEIKYISSGPTDDPIKWIGRALSWVKEFTKESLEEELRIDHSAMARYYSNPRRNCFGEVLAFRMRKPGYRQDLCGFNYP